MIINDDGAFYDWGLHDHLPGEMPRSHLSNDSVARRRQKITLPINYRGDIAVNKSIGTTIPSHKAMDSGAANIRQLHSSHY
jgi:hypothetical protein